MTSDRTHAIAASTIIGSLMALIIGLVAGSSDLGAQVALMAILLVVAAGGSFIGVLLHQAGQLKRDNTALTRAATTARAAEADLRTQLRFPARDAIASIVSLSDQLLTASDRCDEAARTKLRAIRHSASEVEQTLDCLATDTARKPVATPALNTVVLLDEELATITASNKDPNRLIFDLDEARALGDPAKVRQILRTLVNLSTQSEGAQLTLQTIQRGPSATVTMSGKGAILPLAARAGLSEEPWLAAYDDGMYEAARTALGSARSMNGSVSYVQAFGVSHVLFTLPAPQIPEAQRATRASVELSA
ncbi:MAG: hypothetical protein R2823_04220 [Acidimicrobiia bacterium]